ncbi:MAG: class I SAM-dependent methyltransferase [Microcoleaceae cyanobacterium]
MNKQDFFNNWANSYDCLFPSAFYQAIHQRLLEYVNLPPTANILDLGCGTGKLLTRLAKTYPHLTGTGLDFSPIMLKKAKERNYDPQRLHFTAGEAENLPFPDQQFDAVFNTISFLHYQHPEQVLWEVKRVLKSPGYFYLADYSYQAQDETKVSFSPQGLKFYSRKKRQELADAVGLNCLSHHYLLGPIILTIFVKD